MRFVLLVALVLSACGGGDGDPPAIDAPASADADPGADAPGDGGSLPACTGAAYDPCTDNSQCSSQQCRLFMADGIQVCTQNCDASNPCPDFNGQPVQCNNMGRCKPPAANACMR